MHEPPGTAWAQPALRTALHWFGVLVAIELVYIFIGAGRLTNANTGLMNGTILALGTFTSGVHANWRLVVIAPRSPSARWRSPTSNSTCRSCSPWRCSPSASSSSSRVGAAAATAKRARAGAGAGAGGGGLSDARLQLSPFTVGHPTLILFFILMLGAAGAMSYLRLGRAEDPDFTIKVAIVSARPPPIPGNRAGRPARRCRQGTWPRPRAPGELTQGVAQEARVTEPRR